MGRYFTVVEGDIFRHGQQLPGYVPLDRTVCGKGFRMEVGGGVEGGGGCGGGGGGGGTAMTLQAVTNARAQRCTNKSRRGNHLSCHKNEEERTSPDGSADARTRDNRSVTMTNRGGDGPGDITACPRHRPAPGSD